MKTRKKISWLSYFLIAVERHHDQSNLQKKEFIENLQFRGWTRDYHSREHGSKQADIVMEQQLETCILHSDRRQRHKGGEANWDRCGLLKPKSPYQWHNSSNKGIPPNSFRQSHPLGPSPTFKYVSLWGGIKIQTTTPQKPQLCPFSKRLTLLSSIE